MNIGGCCTGLRAQLNAEKLQKLLQILRFLPTKGSQDEMPEFEAILEDVKKFLKDVDDFLSNTLKKEKLKKDATARKEQLLSDLNGLRSKLPPERIPEDFDSDEDYNVAAPPAATSAEDDFFMIEGDSSLIYDDTAATPMDTTVSSDPDQTMKTELDSGDQDDNGNDIDDNKSINWDEPYGDMKIAPIGAVELESPYKTGWLDKKRKEGNIGLPGWQRRYCVIKSNILYYFKKETDRKQCNCIILNGYEGRPAAKQKKNQYLFELICPGKRTFQFVAKTETEMVEWIEAIGKASDTPPDLTLTKMPTNPGTVSNASSSSRENLLDNQELEMNTTADTDELYDDTAEPQTDDQETYEVVEKTTAPNSPQEEEFAEIGEDEELYEDVGTPATQVSSFPARLPKQEARKPLPPAPESQEPKSPKQAAPLPNRPIARPQPPIPQAPTPGTQTIQKSDTTANDEPWEEDFDNIYIGKWDCDPDDNDELGFKRGDLLHILSREYDIHNWWVAEKRNKVGLVPKDYLMKAYMM